MTKEEREVMQQALQWFRVHLACDTDCDCNGRKTFTAIEKCLANDTSQERVDKTSESVHEPVVWMYQDKISHAVKFQKHMSDFVDHSRWYETPLYTTSPQRTWVALTDEEISACSKGNMTRSGFARTIEAKLREKNT